MLKILLLLLIVGYFFNPPAYSSPSGDQIIITEVLYDTPGTDADEEWFELFNPTDDAVNLTDWTIEDNVDTFTFPLVSIPAKGYLVIAKNAIGFNNIYGFDPDVSGLNLFLGNSGDKLTLYNNDSVEVDFVAWEEGEPGWDVSAVHTTIRRINATDTDTVADWEDSTTIGNPGEGSYIIIPELPNSLASVFVLLISTLTIVGLRFRRKK